MDSKGLPNFVQNLLSKIIEENGFSDYSVDVDCGSQAGDGFGSNIQKIAIIENDSERRLDLVCKVAPQNENLRKEFLSNITFSREALFYNTLMPIFTKFQDEKNVPIDKQFRSFPKCYASIADDDKEQYAIFLENLRPQGFRMWNKAKPATIENIRLTLRELGKFHGLSVAMKDQKSKEFADFKKVTDIFIVCCQSDKLRAMFHGFYDRAINSLRSEDHKNIMRHIKANLLTYMTDVLSEQAAEPFGVLSHGDCWNNNYLYRFNEQDIAHDIRFLDWQVIRYASPAIDLLLIIFTSTDKAFRDKEFDNLLNCYYESLSTTVKLLGSDPNELFTFQNLKDEIKRCGNYALMLAPSVIQVLQADSSEITNLDEIMDEVARGERQIELTGSLGGRGQLEYDRRLNEVFEDIVRLGFYRKID